MSVGIGELHKRNLLDGVNLPRKTSALLSVQRQWDECDYLTLEPFFSTLSSYQKSELRSYILTELSFHQNAKPIL